MPDERPVDPQDPEGLGLSAEDLADFDRDVEVGGEDDVGDQESTLAQPPALITEEQGAPVKADQPPAPAKPAEGQPESVTKVTTRPKFTSESSSRSEERQPAAGDQPTDPAQSAPKTETTAVVPWEPQADGRRLPIEGATVEADGSWKIPPGKAQSQLTSCLAFRPAWQVERRRYRDAIAALDPQTNRDVVLGRLIAEQMEAAAKESDEKLWEYVQGFLEKLPELRAKADLAAEKAKNKRLETRTQESDREEAWQELEPQLRAGLTSELDIYLALPQFQKLQPRRQEIAARLWNDLFHETFAQADRDYPDYKLVKGQPFIQRAVIERELTFAAKLLAHETQAQQGADVRQAAAKRNAAAMKDTPAPPAAPVGGAVIAGTGADNRPKTREEWADRMERLASTP